MGSVVHRMSRKGEGDGRPVIRMMPVEFGYGPLGKALHIARAVRRLAGTAVTLELVASENFRSPVDAGLFDRVTPAASGARTADAVITVMNIKGIRETAARGERIYVVDSLAWLWDEPLPVQDLIHTYFYQDLPILPVPPRNIARMPNPTPISAIGELPQDFPSPDPSTDTHSTPDLVISLSGIETPDSRLAWNDLAYPPYLLDSLAHLAADGRLDVGRLALFGNTTVLRHFMSDRLTPALRPGSQSEFGKSVRAAGRIACPPGLTTIVECLRAGIGLRLLPPQNYSQVKLMKAFTDGARIPAMPWGGVVDQWLREVTLPENVGAAIVRGMVAAERLKSRHADPEAFLSFLRQDSPALDSETVNGLIGPGDGALTVAETVLNDLTMSQR